MAEEILHSLTWKQTPLAEGIAQFCRYISYIPFFPAPVSVRRPLGCHLGSWHIGVGIPKYCIGQKICLGFCVTSYQKPKRTCWPTQYLVSFPLKGHPFRMLHFSLNKTFSYFKAGCLLRHSCLVSHRGLRNMSIYS